MGAADEIRRRHTQDGEGSVVPLADQEPGSKRGSLFTMNK